MNEEKIRKELERRAVSFRLFLEATCALERFVGSRDYSLERKGRSVSVILNGQVASVAFSRTQLNRFPFYGDSRDFDIGVSHGLVLYHELIDQVIEIEQEAEQEQREQELHQAIACSESVEAEPNR